MLYIALRRIIARNQALDSENPQSEKIHLPFFMVKMLSDGRIDWNPYFQRLEIGSSRPVELLNENDLFSRMGLVDLGLETLRKELPSDFVKLLEQSG